MKYLTKIFLVILCLTTLACADDDENRLFYGDQEQTLIGYMETNKTAYSSFLELLKKTDYTALFRTYGNYTLFTFTNAAWDQYLHDVQRNSMSDFSKEELLELVKSHTIATSRLTSQNFKNGNLDQINMMRENLVVKFAGGNEIFINGNKILTRDVELLNGVLFQIEGVLVPQKKTLREVVASLEGYTIFENALTATGLDKYLSQLVDDKGFAVSYTVLLNPDKTYTAAAITTYEALKAHIDSETTLADTNPESPIYQYVSRHIINKTVFQNRFSTQLYPTMGRLFLDVVVDKNFIINPDSPKPASILLSEGNIMAKNGVCHILTSMLDLSKVKAKPVFFDFAEQPELIEWKAKNAGSWGSLSEQYTNEGTYANINTNCLQFFYYHVPTPNDSSTGGYGALHNHDGMLAKSGNWFMEYPINNIPAGKYELWLHVLKAHASGAVAQCYWDDIKVGRVFGLSPNSGRWVGGVEVDKWGPAGANFKFRQLYPGNYDVLALYLGNVNVTNQHKFTMRTVIDGLGLIDRLEFIPIVESDTEGE